MPGRLLQARSPARNSLLLMRLVALLYSSIHCVAGFERSPALLIATTVWVGMPLARLGRPVDISHLGDRRLRCVLVHLLEQPPSVSRLSPPIKLEICIRPTQYNRKRQPFGDDSALRVSPLELLFQRGHKRLG